MVEGEEGVGETLDWKESYWGYVLSMGSTEGNLFGLWNARDYLKGKKLFIDDEKLQRIAAIRKKPVKETLLKWIQSIPPIVDPGDETKYHPIAFFSGDSHYSIAKIMRVLEIDTFHDAGTELYEGECPKELQDEDGDWPVAVPSDEYGSVDVDKLKDLVKFFAEKGHPIIVSLNYGTTFTGAYDDVGEVCKELKPILEDNGLWNRQVEWRDKKVEPRRGFWIHVDGALGAAFMPFVKAAEDDDDVDFDPPEPFVPFPEFDFGLEMVNSIVMSGHKWTGAPWPCGVYMTRTKYLLENDVPGYVGGLDSTLAGSRNGFSALILWDYLAKHGYEEQTEKATRLIGLARYAENELIELEDILQKKGINISLEVALSPRSLAVRFTEPNDKMIEKYSLSVDDGIAHFFVMDQVDKERIDGLIEDLKECGFKTEDEIDRTTSFARSQHIRSGW